MPPLIRGWLRCDFMADGSALPVLKKAKIGTGLFLKTAKQPVHGKFVIIVVFLGDLQHKNIKRCTVQDRGCWEEARLSCISHLPLHISLFIANRRLDHLSLQRAFGCDRHRRCYKTFSARYLFLACSARVVPVPHTGLLLQGPGWDGRVTVSSQGHQELWLLLPCLFNSL